MRGAILGDMIGAPYEGKEYKTKDFELFGPKSRFTDDTVMTIAVADALMYSREKGVENDENAVKRNIATCMRYWGDKFPHAGYGKGFSKWLKDRNMWAYHSFGNGSAMRVASIAWLYDDLDTVKKMAAWSAEVTHDHPEGVKGAMAIACAIFMARKGVSKDEIKTYIMDEFGYDLNHTIDEIRPHYHFSSSCQKTVPEAIIAFMDGTDLEDVIRLAVSLGGDTDTLACMAGGIAEAYYGIPLLLQAECDRRLTDKMKSVLERFDKAIGRKQDRVDRFKGNKELEEALKHTETYEDQTHLIMTFVKRILERGEFILPVEMSNNLFDMMDIENLKVGDTFQTKEEVRMKWLTLPSKDGLEWYGAFTNQEQMDKGQGASCINMRIRNVLESALQAEDVAGIALNPWDNSLIMSKELIELILSLAKPGNKIDLAVADIHKLDMECIVDVEGEDEISLTDGNEYTDYIMHLKFPENYQEDNYSKLLEDCILQCLELAKTKDIHTLVFPGIITYPEFELYDEVAKTMLVTISNWLDQNPDYGMRVIIVSKNEEIDQRYQRVVRLSHMRNIDIEPEQYDKINPKEIVAFSLAEGGAMGCPNEMIYMRKNGDTAELLRSYVNPKIFTLFPWLEHLDCGFFGEVSGVGRGWKHIDMGAGNHLFLRTNVYKVLYPKFKGKHPAMIYQTWQDAVAEYLL